MGAKKVDGEASAAEEGRTEPIVKYGPNAGTGLGLTERGMATFEGDICSAAAAPGTSTDTKSQPLDSMMIAGCDELRPQICPPRVHEPKFRLQLPILPVSAPSYQVFLVAVGERYSHLHASKSALIITAGPSLLDVYYRNSYPIDSGTQPLRLR